MDIDKQAHVNNTLKSLKSAMLAEKDQDLDDACNDTNIILTKKEKNTTPLKPVVIEKPSENKAVNLKKSSKDNSHIDSMDLEEDDTIAVFNSELMDNNVIVSDTDDIFILTKMILPNGKIRNLNVS
jgi:hypothetical protein